VPPSAACQDRVSSVLAATDECAPTALTVT
jgi:hypothetical protein